MAEVDPEIEARLTGLETSPAAQAEPPARTKKSRHQEPTSFDMRSELYRIFGVDLTEVPGISGVTAHTILREIGPDLSPFRNASAFASWLGYARNGKSAAARSCSPRAAV